MVSFISALHTAGGPCLDEGFKCGRGVARFGSVILGGPVVGMLM